MSFRDRAYLTWSYGKTQFFVGAMYNLFYTWLLKTDFSYSFLVDAFILKPMDEPFSQIDPVNIEAVQQLIREKARDHGIIITDHNYEAISSVADNLFVIADGYTAPVHSREDLVRYGYLR